MQIPPPHQKPSTKPKYKYKFKSEAQIQSQNTQPRSAEGRRIMSIIKSRIRNGWPTGALKLLDNPASLKKLTKYHKILNDCSRVKFAKPEEINELKGKIISALNLAFISYDYKFKLRTHKHLFWPDGVFSSYIFKMIQNFNKIFYSKVRP